MVGGALKTGASARRGTFQRYGARADHVDDIRPVLSGGTDDLSNLQALRSACNLANRAT